MRRNDVNLLLMVNNTWTSSTQWGFFLNFFVLTWEKGGLIAKIKGMSSIDLLSAEISF